MELDHRSKSSKEPAPQVVAVWADALEHPVVYEFVVALVGECLAGGCLAGTPLVHLRMKARSKAL